MLRSLRNSLKREEDLDPKEEVEVVAVATEKEVTEVVTEKVVTEVIAEEEVASEEVTEKIDLKVLKKVLKVKISQESPKVLKELLLKAVLLLLPKEPPKEEVDILEVDIPEVEKREAPMFPVEIEVPMFPEEIELTEEATEVVILEVAKASQEEEIEVVTPEVEIEVDSEVLLKVMHPSMSEPPQTPKLNEERSYLFITSE